jgi:hypothetical protein
MLRRLLCFAGLALFASPAWADASGKKLLEIDRQFAADAQKFGVPGLCQILGRNSDRKPVTAQAESGACPTLGRIMPASSRPAHTSTGSPKTASR